MGLLKVSTTPVSGEVYVNGSFIGRGYAVAELKVGSYLVSFGPVTGYVNPAYQTVIIQRDRTTEVTGVYVVLPPISGTLKVATTPVAGDIFVNGELIGNGSISIPLLVGLYTVSFGSVTNHITPNNFTASVFENQTTVITGVYIEYTPPNGNGPPPNGNDNGNGLPPPIPWIPIAVVSAIVLVTAILWLKR